MKKIMSIMTVVTAFCSLLITACSKDDNGNGKATVNMRLTDGPAAYDAIYLDIQQVAVTMEGSSTVTLTPVRPGVYNMLRFRNGLDTLLLRTDLPAGRINQIRLILGNNNSIVVNGNTYPLNTPSGQQSGVKLNLNQTLNAGGAYTIWIDFDAAKSIVETGNGSYNLKPVIRAYSSETDGRIEGYVLPVAAFATVYAIQGTDTFSAIPDPVDGYFRFGGLPSGTYSVWFDATVAGYQDQLMTNVQVSYAKETNLGVVTLVF